MKLITAFLPLQELHRCSLACWVRDVQTVVGGKHQPKSITKDGDVASNNDLVHRLQSTLAAKEELPVKHIHKRWDL